jgi:hypothetical protein
MDISRATLGTLAVAGVIAAGGGAYIAGRQSPAVETQAVSAPEPVSGMVTETENSVVLPPSAVTIEPVKPVVAEPTAARPPAPSPARATRQPAARTAPPASPAPQASSRPVPSSVPVDPPVAAAIEPLDSTTVETAPIAQDAPQAPRKLYEELVVPADSVIGLQVDNAVSSDQAKVEDTVRARVTRDVKVRDRVAIPAGARAEGSITLVDRGGRLKDQARLGIRFHTIVLDDGTRLPIQTETIYRVGDSPARESAAKIGGGAVGGAVLGAIFGGKKGAIIGSTVGAAGGGVAVATSEPNPATLPAGSALTVRISSPAAVTVEQ